MGGDYFALCLALEELARVDSSVAITLEAGVSLGAMPIYRFGTEEQKREWLPRAVRGRRARRVRPDRARRRLRRGRHPHHRPARRRRVGDQRLEGVHHQLRHRHHRRSSRSPRSPATAAPTATARSPRSWCPRARRASRVSQKYSKVGWNASDTRELFFDDVPRAGRQPLGERGRGYAQFLSILDEGRVAIAALAVGLAQGCVDESVRYAHDRQAFGHSIGSYQAIQFKIADMEVRAHTARLAYYAAAAKMLRRAAVQEGGGDREARRVQRGHGQRPRRPPRCSAATAS